MSVIKYNHFNKFAAGGGEFATLLPKDPRLFFIMGSRWRSSSLDYFVRLLLAYLAH